MPTQNEPASLQGANGSSRQQRLLACTLVLLLVASVVGLISLTRQGGHMGNSPELLEPLQQMPSSTRTPSGKQGESEAVDRLRQILRIREEAYNYRNAELLNAIYTSDCPCLSNDTRAIQELLRRRYIWKNIDSSIEVRRVQRVSERSWSILALFRAEPLRIETEGGRLVREEPRATELFQFILANSPGTRSLLLARAVQYKGGFK